MIARSLGGTRGIPKWVQRRRGNRLPLSVKEGHKQNYPRIEMYNFVPYASNAQIKGQIDYALSRERLFLMKEIERKIQSDAKQIR
jgi:hypothetical protein